MAKILKRYLLIRKKVLYKFPIDIASKLSILHASPKKNCSVNLHIATHLCQFMAQNFKIWRGG